MGDGELSDDVVATLNLDLAIGAEAHLEKEGDPTSQMNASVSDKGVNTNLGRDVNIARKVSQGIIPPGSADGQDSEDDDRVPDHEELKEDA